MARDFLQKLQVAKQEFENGKTIRKILFSGNPGIVKSPSKIIAEIRKAKSSLAYKVVSPAAKKAYTKQLIRDILARR